MPAKRNLKFLLLRLFYHLRGLKAMFWVPMVGMNVLLPLLNYRSFLKAGADELALLPQEFHRLMRLPRLFCAYGGFFLCCVNMWNRMGLRFCMRAPPVRKSETRWLCFCFSWRI